MYLKMIWKSVEKRGLCLSLSSVQRCCDEAVGIDTRLPAWWVAYLAEVHSPFQKNVMTEVFVIMTSLNRKNSGVFVIVRSILFISQHIYIILYILFMTSMTINK